MRIIIIEDEKPAADKLRKALLKINSNIEILAVLNSVRDSVSWLKQNEEPGLIFMDIELTDGSSFRIFEEVRPSCPIIFTTAYDEYWQEAFEHNSIDYILKPIRQEKLETALMKYDKLKQFFSQNIEQLVKHNQNGSNETKERFLVKRGSDYISIKSTDIAYFYATHKMVCMVGSKNQKYIMDQSLADLEKQVDPKLFFRINRKYLVNMQAIKRIKAYAKSKLMLELEPPITEDVIVSQENVALFKQWMGQ